MDDRPRWERDAERLRTNAPPWFDFNRLPWWLFAVVGIGFAARGLYLLLASGISGWDRVAAVGLLVLVAPSQFLMARQRYKGEPLWGGNGTR